MSETGHVNEDELTSLDATAQAELVRRGEVEARELVEAAISRIERLNPNTVNLGASAGVRRV